MKSKIKGFTIVELIVVMAILGILMGILVPMLFKYMDDAKETKLNMTAKNIHTSAIAAIAKFNASGDIVIKPNCIYLGSSDGIAHPEGGGDECDLSAFIGEDFSGSFAFVTNDGGNGCAYAIWSNFTIEADDVKQFTEAEVRNSLGTSLPIGCYPFKTSNT